MAGSRARRQALQARQIQDHLTTLRPEAGLRSGTSDPLFPNIKRKGHPMKRGEKSTAGKGRRCCTQRLVPMDCDDSGLSCPSLSVQSFGHLAKLFPQLPGATSGTTTSPFASSGFLTPFYRMPLPFCVRKQGIRRARTSLGQVILGALILPPLGHFLPFPLLSACHKFSPGP